MIRRLVVWLAGVVEASLLAFAVLLLIALAARADDHAGHSSGHSLGHGHARFHASYQSWVNRDNRGCCNDRHCRPLADADERSAGGVLEVRIEGAWCEVAPRHYLKTGNVPDASTSHVCFWNATDEGWQGKGPCERFLCYQPKPGS